MKVKELQAILRKKKLNGCVLYADDPNFRYYLQEYLMDGLLFIPSAGRPTVFVHRLENLKHKFRVIRIDRGKTIKEFFKKNKVKKVGYNPSFTNVTRYFRLRSLFKLKNIELDLENLRIIKTNKEIEYLKKAANIADSILKKLINNFKFKTELDIKKFLKGEFARYGVEQSFEPIVASGVGASVPHYFGNSKLRKGFLIIDMGVKWKGYCSDITRTFFIGKPTKKELALYNKVLKVQLDCIKMCTKGRKCSDSFDHAYQVLGKEFVHGLGHGVGLKIHELPNLKPNNSEKFENNMVFTVEPGIYNEKKKIGIRIEDDLMIKNGKPVLLTKTSKKLICF